MKNFIKLKQAITLVLLLIPFYSIAQSRNKEKNKADFGLVFGPNFTRASLSSYIPSAAAFGNYDYSHFGIGLDLKLFASIPISTELSFYPELGFALYNQRQYYSYDSRNSIGSVNHSDKLSESLITFEPLLKYKIRSYYISAGPQIGIISGAKIKSAEGFNGYGNPAGNNTETDFKKDEKVYNPAFALILGAGKNHISKTLGAGLYYRVGVSNFTEYYNIQQIKKVNGFLLQLNYYFQK